jgi:hypothetical protein
MAIGAVEGLTAANVRRTVQGAALGLGIGLVGGAFGGVFGQLLYGTFGGGNPDLPIVLQIFVRSAGWGLIGICIGACLGLAPALLMRSTKKAVNGFIGGLLGGGIGGFLFDPIGLVVGSGELSRMVAMSVLGAAAGAAIGVVEEIRKEAWLVITAGPLTGKQFILYNPVTTIGRSPKADIMLVKEAGACDIHCRILRHDSRMTLEDLSGGNTFLGERPIAHAALRNGDVITIGSTQFTFYERVARGSA